MVEAFDRIVVAVPDVEHAATEYAILLGSQPRTVSGASRPASQYFSLENTMLELRETQVQAAKIDAIVLRDPASLPAVAAVENPLDINVGVCNGDEFADLSAPHNALRVDHLVLRTAKPDAAIALFRDELGVRLALDKTVPQWGGRMLFFRTGKLTLEVIASEEEASQNSKFWGIAYQVADIDRYCREFRDRGGLVSDIRDGRKPGTRVATAKSHCLELPTLIIEPTGSSASGDDGH